MADLKLEVMKWSGKLLVYADNTAGDYVAIVDHIVLEIRYLEFGVTSSIWFYEEDFVFSARVGTGWKGKMVELSYSGGPVQVQATAEYWHVDQTVKSPKVTV